MGDTCERLDFLALLDEVADDTVNRLVREMGTETAPYELVHRDTLDLLSICDQTSINMDCDVSLTTNQYQPEEADTEMHVQQDRHDEAKNSKKVDCELSGQCSIHPGQNIPRQPPEETDQSPSSKQRSTAVLTDTATGHKLSTRRRLQLTQWQRDELDAVFEENMYPSKWKLTELSGVLHIPMNSLRVWFQNRRWRFRKSRGLKGNHQTRGRRSMQQDTNNSPLKERHKHPVPSSRLARSLALSTNQHQVFSELVSTPRPLHSSSGSVFSTSSIPSTTGMLGSMPSTFTQGTAPSISVPCLLANPSPLLSHPSPGLFLMSTLPLVSGDYGQYEKAWSTELSNLPASWNHPSPLNCMVLQPFPFVYPPQWFSYAYGLPQIPVLHSSREMSTLATPNAVIRPAETSHVPVLSSLKTDTAAKTHHVPVLSSLKTDAAAKTGHMSVMSSLKTETDIIAAKTGHVVLPLSTNTAPSSLSRQNLVNWESGQAGTFPYPLNSPPDPLSTAPHLKVSDKTEASIVTYTVTNTSSATDATIPWSISQDQQHA